MLLGGFQTVDIQPDSTKKQAASTTTGLDTTLLSEPMIPGDSDVTRVETPEITEA